MDYEFFEIEVVESTGLLGKVGSPVLFCRVAGILINGGFLHEANIVILHYDDSQKKWDEHKRIVELNQSQKIIERVKRLGIPERLPEVEGFHATAPFWISLSLKITFDNKRFYLDISAAEGISGKDGNNLQELFQFIFELVGYQGSSILFSKNYFASGNAANNLKQSESSFEIIPIPLENNIPTLYMAQIEDDRLLNEAEFYLAIKTKVPESELIEGFPRIAKVSSREVIDTVIGRALPGVLLAHIPTPPIPIKPGFQCFKLDTQSPYWEGVKKSKNLVVRITEFNIEQLELLAFFPKF